MSGFNEHREILVLTNYYLLLGILKLKFNIKKENYKRKRTYVLPSEILETETPKNENCYTEKLAILQYPETKSIISQYLKESCLQCSE